MDTEDFIRAYRESRNGANEFYMHNLVKSFQYSDGVRECAQAGAYWLIDVLATELPKVMREHGEHMLIVTVRVAENKADLVATGSGDAERWAKRIDMTDLPDGEWVFYLADEGHRRALVLPTEY